MLVLSVRKNKDTDSPEKTPHGFYMSYLRRLTYEMQLVPYLENLLVYRIKRCRSINL